MNSQVFSEAATRIRTYVLFYDDFIVRFHSVGKQKRVSQRARIVPRRRPYVVLFPASFHCTMATAQHRGEGPRAGGELINC